MIVQDQKVISDGANGSKQRRINRDVHEAARDQLRALMGTEAYDQSACERKLIETSFGDLKRNLGLAH